MRKLNIQCAYDTTQHESKYLICDLGDTQTYRWTLSDILIDYYVLNDHSIWDTFYV